jgi:hypothetical protein
MATSHVGVEVDIDQILAHVHSLDVMSGKPARLAGAAA